MDRIEGQLVDQKELAKQVLMWITCAKRPLTTSEICCALAVEVGKLELDEENLPDITDMVSVCAGLVTVDDISNVIRLVHYTTQEYFERTQKHWFPSAETDITRTCVTYLSFSIFESGLCRSDDSFNDRLRTNQLYDYAAHNWGYHARAASVGVEQLITQFLESDAKVSGSTQAMMIRYGDSQQVPRQVIGVHLAAYFGLNDAIIALLKDGNKLDSKDDRGRTPLSWVAAQGHEAVVKLLVERDDVPADSKDRDGRTPLSWAAEGGHETVVKLLVERDDVAADSKDRYGQTPLSRAAARGHETVIKLLVERDDVAADSKARDGRMPLSWAAARGHEAVVKLLVERDDVAADSKDRFGRTPLSWAAAEGHEAVVKLLVERDDVTADSKDRFSRTPLSWAATGGHEAVVKLLIERDDVAANLKDSYG
jgi:ankyrin repeat protein